MRRGSCCFLMKSCLTNLARKASSMTTHQQQPKLLTYKQIATRLGISLNTARKLFDDGELHRIKVSTRAVRGSAAEVEAFILRRTHKESPLT